MSEKTIQMNSDGVDDAIASMSAVSLSSRSMAISSEKTIQLRCGDGRTIELDDATAFMSESIKSSITWARRHRKWHRIIDKLSEDPKLSRIPSQLVEKVFQYCERHAHAGPHDDLTAFDAQFCNLDPYELCKLSMKSRALTSC